MKQGEPLRLGVIGLGAMGLRHAQAIVELPGTELAAVSDVNAETLARVTAQYGVAGYADYRELLRHPGLQGVVVVTPDALHREPCVAAAAAGLPVLLEKPLASTLEDGQAIVAAARERGTALMVGHIVRYSPRYIAVREAIRAGKLGEILHIYTRRNATVNSGRRLGGRVSPALFQYIHDLDALRWLTGLEVERVYAEAASKVLAEFGVPDSCFATLRFRGGAIAGMETSWALPAGVPNLLDAKLEVVGTQGVANIDEASQGISFFMDGRYSLPEMTYFVPPLHVLKDEITRFADVVQAGAEPSASGDDALAALRIAPSM
jgi:predicted dehydrogenase